MERDNLEEDNGVPNESMIEDDDDIRKTLNEMEK
jgi:hypothetical protein